MLEISDMTFAYRRGQPILDRISFSLETGDCLAVLGNNGAGKSTLLQCIDHILRPQAGAVRLNGEDLLRMSNLEAARRMSFVAQKNGISNMSVYDTVLLGRKPYMRLGAGARDYAIVDAVLVQMGLTGMADNSVAEMSGGEQQKVMLARALAQEPQLLLLDEPTSNLDLRNQYEVMRMVSRVCHEQGITAIVVLHDLNLALRYCSRFLLLKDRRIYGMGGAEILTEQNIAAVYGIAVRVRDVDGQRIVIVR